MEVPSLWQKKTILLKAANAWIHYEWEECPNFFSNQICKKKKCEHSVPLPEKEMRNHTITSCG